MAPPCSVLIIALLVINSSVFSTSDFIYVDQESDNETFVYGDCEPANKNCTDCYLTLKKSLLRRDRNIRNLSVAFFPPKDNIPEFVAVTYCFDDHCTEKKRWFWTHDSSYLFFPIETFQYLSLFFGKPAAFFSREVQLRLDEECQNASIDMFTLLTQRLKNFVQRASVDPVIDDNYFARAEESDEDYLTTPRARYLLSFYIVGFAFAIIITLILLFTYLNTKRWDKKLSKATPTKKENKYLQSKIFSVAATTFFINLYALVLDGVAIGSKLRGEVPIDEHYIHALPYFVIAMDGLCIIFWLACWVFSLCSFICNCNREYQGLAISTIGPTLSLVVHLPYIAIAYLNDAAYATSIFIYYTVTTFVLFGILDLTYGTCQGSIIAISNNHNQVDGGFFCCPKNKTARRCIFTFLIPLFAVIVLGFACMITAALVIVPISKAFSDVPNRLLGFYQTAVILVGAYLVYRSFFKQIPSIDLVVKKRLEHIQTNNVENDDQWQHLSKDERVIEFYSRCVEIVANHPLGIAREHRGERDATTPPPEGERARLVQSI